MDSEAPQGKLKWYSVSQLTMPLLLYPQLLRRSILAIERSQLEGSGLMFFSTSGLEGAVGRMLSLLALSLKNSLILGCDSATSSEFRGVIRITFFFCSLT